MNKLLNLFKTYTQVLTPRRILGTVLGNLILGISAAGLAYSLMGNDPYTAMNMAVSDALGVGLGNYQLLINCLLLIIQLIWGRNYIGLGSVVNIFFLGYVIEYTGYALRLLLGSPEDHTFLQRLFIMLLSLIVISFGLSMYQTAALGVSPYDYLALGLTDHLPTPYFTNRITTDVVCVLVIITTLCCGVTTWEISHLGIGTICVAFFLGPFVNFFNKYNQRWIR